MCMWQLLYWGAPFGVIWLINHPAPPWQIDNCPVIYEWAPLSPEVRTKVFCPCFFQLLCFKTLLGIFGDLRVKYCIRSLHILDPGVNKHYCKIVFTIMHHSSTTFCALYEKCPLGSKCWNHLSWFCRNFETLETWWTGAKLPRVRRRCSNTKRIQNDPLPLQFLLNW